MPSSAVAAPSEAQTGITGVWNSSYVNSAAAARAKLEPLGKIFGRFGSQNLPIWQETTSAAFPCTTAFSLRPAAQKAFMEPDRLVALLGTPANGGFDPLRMVG
jgi:hypothetical protein